MNCIHKINWRYFTVFEWALWLGSAAAIAVLSFVGGMGEPLQTTTSIVGVTSLIFVAKGNPAGQAIVIIFSVLYAIVSWKFRYYGEMLTYVLMSAPCAAVTMIKWLKNMSAGANEVKVAEISCRKFFILLLISLTVTGIFYFILRYFETPNLLFSTISVFTSFLAAGLMFLRSPYYAVAYGANDIVLIVLWVMASVKDIGYAPMAMNFLVFLVNDIYGFINWSHMKKSQVAAA